MGCVSAFIDYSLCVFFILSLSLSVSEFECEWVCGCVCFQVKAGGVVSQVLSILFLETEWCSQHRRQCSLEFSFSLVYTPPHTCSNAFGSQIPSPASTSHTHLSPNKPSTLRNPQSPSCVRLHILPSLNNSLSSTPGNNQTDNILYFLSFFVFSLFFLMRGEWRQ